MTRYCSKCGSKLNMKRILWGYSVFTGDPCYRIEGRCPKDHWWNMGHTIGLFQEEVERKAIKGKWGTAQP